MRPVFALLTFAALVSTGTRAADPPAAMDVLDPGETAEHAAGRMPPVPAAAPEPKKQGHATVRDRVNYVPDDVLRDRGFSAVQTVQQQVGFGTGNDVGREGRDVARELRHKGHEDKGDGGGKHGDGEGNGHHH